MKSLKLQAVAVLMPLDIERHAIPHLKALTCSIEHESGQRYGSTLIYNQNSYLDRTYFTSYKGKLT